MASTPSFLSALATRLPPEIFGLASVAASGAALSDEPSVDLLAAPAMFILLREQFHFVYFRAFQFPRWNGANFKRARESPHAKSPHAQRFIYRLATSPANR
jgi:hypothetical protein